MTKKQLFSNGMIEYLIFELGCWNSEKSVKMRKRQQAYTHVRSEEYVKLDTFPQ